MSSRCQTTDLLFLYFVTGSCSQPSFTEFKIRSLKAEAAVCIGSNLYGLNAGTLQFQGHRLTCNDRTCNLGIILSGIEVATVLRQRKVQLNGLVLYGYRIVTLEQFAVALTGQFQRYLIPAKLTEAARYSKGIVALLQPDLCGLTKIRGKGEVFRHGIGGLDLHGATVTLFTAIATTSFIGLYYITKS